MLMADHHDYTGSGRAHGAHEGHSHGAPRPELEYTTLGWNAVAVPILLITVAGAGSVALAGRRLGNRVLQTESRVTVIDGALAAAVLAGLVLNAMLGWWWADSLSALVILTYGLREARHAWAEAA